MIAGYIRNTAAPAHLRRNVRQPLTAPVFTHAAYPAVAIYQIYLISDVVGELNRLSVHNIHPYVFRPFGRLRQSRHPDAVAGKYPHPIVNYV